MWSLLTLVWSLLTLRAAAAHEHAVRQEEARRAVFVVEEEEARIADVDVEVRRLQSQLVDECAHELKMEGQLRLRTAAYARREEAWEEEKASFQRELQVALSLAEERRSEFVANNRRVQQALARANSLEDDVLHRRLRFRHQELAHLVECCKRVREARELALAAYTAHAEQALGRKREQLDKQLSALADLRFS